MIFLDTCYLISLIDKKEPHHVDSLEIQEYLLNTNEKTIINTTVLVETLNRSIKTNTFAGKMFNYLNSKHEIIKLTSDDYLQSLDLNMWYGNSINYSDCTIINTMIKMGVTDIVTFDGDFKKVDGFNIINCV